MHIQKIILFTIIMASGLSYNQAQAHTVDPVVERAAEAVCPAYARTSPALKQEYLEQIEKEATREGYKPNQVRLLINKCKNWKQ